MNKTIRTLVYYYFLVYCLLLNVVWLPHMTSVILWLHIIAQINLQQRWWTVAYTWMFFPLGVILKHQARTKSSFYDICQSGYHYWTLLTVFWLKTIVRISIIKFYLLPETILYLQIWPKNAKRLDIPDLDGVRLGSFDAKRKFIWHFQCLFVEILAYNMARL